MVAKDYPFYLSVKRANCALEAQTVTSPAKETEVLNLLVMWLQLFIFLYRVICIALGKRNVL